MKTLLAFSVATIYGLSIRLLFGVFEGFLQVMSITFLCLVPVLIGFVTVFSLRKKVKNYGAAFFLPWLTSLVLLLTTLLMGVEGFICWLMVFPLFAILASIGGCGMFYFIKKKRNSEKGVEDEWEQPGGLQTSIFLLAPLLLGLVEGDRTLRTINETLVLEVEVSASPQEVWNFILADKELANNSKNTPISSFLGFPQHIKTTLDKKDLGGKRIALYEKSLYFEEIIKVYDEPKELRLEVNTDPDKISPEVMDEHILIGGEYLDILEDAYVLEALPSGGTRILLESTYKIRTPFNWYAEYWAKLFLSDVLEGELEFIQKHFS